MLPANRLLMQSIVSPHFSADASVRSFCEGRFGSKAPFHGSDRNRTGGPRAYRQSDGLPGRVVVGALAAGARGLQIGRMVPWCHDGSC